LHYVPTFAELKFNTTQEFNTLLNLDKD